MSEIASSRNNSLYSYQQKRPPIEEKIALIMIKNVDTKQDLAAKEAQRSLLMKQLEALTTITSDFIADKETEITFSQAVAFYE